jgi:hypothetical protein
MRIHRPFALGFDAHITSLCLRVEEEAVVGHDDGFLEAHAAQLVQRDADQLERARDQPQRRLGVAFQLAVDFGRAQHQQVDGLGNLRLAAHKIVEQHLREAITVTLGQHIHALRDIAHRRASQAWAPVSRSPATGSTRACTRQQARHTHQA